MKNFLFGLFVTGLLTSFTLQAQATTQRIIELTDDQDSNINYLSVIENSSGAVTGLESDPDAKNSSSDKASESISLSQIESSAGAVLLVRDGLNALVLQGSLNSQTNVGQFNLSYLSNGLTMSYDSCSFLLKRDQNGWYVQNPTTGARITNVKVETWSLGITTIAGLCS